MLYVQASVDQAEIWVRLLKAQEASPGEHSSMRVNKTYANYVYQRSVQFQRDIQFKVPVNVLV